MPRAARKGDAIEQDAPHCHAAIHPAAPVPTPIPHPTRPLRIISGTIATVLIEGAEAAVAGSTSEICAPPGCVPGGPGHVASGSSSVFVGGQPAARVGDPSSHPGCIAPIPAPTGKVVGPGAGTVLIGS